MFYIINQWFCHNRTIERQKVRYGIYITSDFNFLFVFNAADIIINFESHFYVWENSLSLSFFNKLSWLFDKMLDVVLIW